MVYAILRCSWGEDIYRDTHARFNVYEMLNCDEVTPRGILPFTHESSKNFNPEKTVRTISDARFVWFDYYDKLREIGFENMLIVDEIPAEQVRRGY
jgi:hypothetical protein